MSEIKKISEEIVKLELDMHEINVRASKNDGKYTPEDDAAYKRMEEDLAAKETHVKRLRDHESRSKFVAPAAPQRADRNPMGGYSRCLNARKSDRISNEDVADRDSIESQLRYAFATPQQRADWTLGGTGTGAEMLNQSVSDLVRIIRDDNSVLPYFTVKVMPTISVDKTPIVSDSGVGELLADGADVNAAEGTSAKLELTPKFISSKTWGISWADLNAAGNDFPSVVKDILAFRVSDRIAYYTTIGSGAGSPTQPTGFVTAATNSGVVATTNQAFTFGEMKGLLDAMPARYGNRNPNLFMRRSTWSSVSGLANSDNTNLYVLSNGIESKIVRNFLGVNVVLNEYVPTLAANSSKAVILACPDCFKIALYAGIGVESIPGFSVIDYHVSAYVDSGALDSAGILYLQTRSS